MAASSRLRDPSRYVGWRGTRHEPTAVLLRNNGLHVEIVHRPRRIAIGVRRSGRRRRSAWSRRRITTIQDCEDSVAAADAHDKVGVYRNWLGLMNGSLEAAFAKGGGTVVRNLNDDRRYTDPQGASSRCPAAA